MIQKETYNDTKQPKWDKTTLNNLKQAKTSENYPNGLLK